MTSRRLIAITCTVLVLAQSLAGSPSLAGAQLLLEEKIDPALRTRMQADPLAVLPVIVEMQHPAAPFAPTPNLDRANEGLGLLRRYGVAVGALSLIGSAAGFADASGINALSLVPTVAYIHHDATVGPLTGAAEAPPAAPNEIPPPPTMPPLPTVAPPPTATPVPTPVPSPSPTSAPTPSPTATPTTEPTAAPTPAPTATPAPEPTTTPAPEPTATPTPQPTAMPTSAPTVAPTAEPTGTPAPTASPEVAPQSQPSASPTQSSSVYPTVVGADEAARQGATGRGVTVAILDSGVARDADLGNRILASVNFADERLTQDPGGHGTHVAGIVAGSGARSDGEFVGIAPEANIVDVRVLSSTGGGRISSVVRGIEWVIAHRSVYNIRVMNLSLGAPVTASYRTDPLSAAAEIAWQRGIVVVAASGNGGPRRDTVVSPGIDPYVITVGATDDGGTTSSGDDVLAFFSAWGTAESNPKPDLVAPGRRIVSLRAVGSFMDTLFPDRVVTAANGSTYLRLSGTSMSTPIVSGAVALLLEQRPDLSPDQVKALLVSTAQQYGQDTASTNDAAADGSGLLDIAGAMRVSTPSAPSGDIATAGAVVGGAIASEPVASALQEVATPQVEDLPRANRALRPADPVARALYPFLHGTPLRWRDLAHGGIAWETLDWESVAWDSVAWDNYEWDSVAWDSVAWDSVAWDSVAWDSVAWDSVAWDSVAWDSVAWD
jgi:serine protease AprX